MLGTEPTATLSAGIVIPLFKVPPELTVSAVLLKNVGMLPAPNTAQPLVALAVIAM
jgi:hypothetical protein